MKRSLTSIGISALIWAITSVLGSAILSLQDVTGMPVYQLIGLSLVFSLPAQLIICPAIFIQLRDKKQHALINVMTVAFISCVLVIACFFLLTKNYPINLETSLRLISPYTLAAIFVVPSIFYLVAYLTNKKANR